MVDKRYPIAELAKALTLVGYSLGFLGLSLGWTLAGGELVVGVGAAVVGLGLFGAAVLTARMAEPMPIERVYRISLWVGTAAAVVVAIATVTLNFR